MVACIVQMQRPGASLLFKKKKLPAGPTDVYVSCSPIASSSWISMVDNVFRWPITILLAKDTHQSFSQVCYQRQLSIGIRMLKAMAWIFKKYMDLAKSGIMYTDACSKKRKAW